MNPDVIHLKMNRQFSIKTLIYLTVATAIFLALEVNFGLVTGLVFSLPWPGIVEVLLILGMFALIFVSPALLRYIKFSMLAGSDFQCPICFGTVSPSLNRCTKCGQRFRP